VTAIARAIDRWWLAPAPAERVAALRLLVGGFALVYVAARLPHLVSYGGFDAAAFRPVGVVAVLGRPLGPIAVHAIAGLCVAAGVAFVLGWRFRVFGPLFAGLLLWTLSYRSSWGMIFHTENLLVLHVMVLAVAPAADALSLDARRAAPAAAAAGHGWPIRLMCVIAVATYVLAGVAKLRYGGLGWAGGEVLRDYVATDNARKLLLGSSGSPLASPVLAYPGLFSGLAVLTLAVELGAPLALLGGRLAAAWAAAAVLFHWGVLALMLIVFPYPMCGIGVACFFRAENAIAVVRRLARRLNLRDPGGVSS
jgi:hypothetical protein